MIQPAHIIIPSKRESILPPGVEKPLFPGKRIEPYRAMPTGLAMQRQPLKPVVSGPTFPAAATSFWKMDDAANATRDDFYNLNDLTDVLSNVGQAAGKISNAALFVRASATVLTRTDQASLSLGANTSLTISCWAYITGAGTFYSLVSKFNAVSDVEYSLECRPGNNQIFFYLGKSNNTYSSECTGNFGGSFSSSTWYHIVARYNAGTQIMSIWTNGVKTGGDSSHPNGTRNGANALTVGSSTASGANAATDIMDGRMDGVGIWIGTALTDQQIADLYNAGSGLDPS